MTSYEYQFSSYSFQDTARAQAAKAAMDKMTADGWHIHTANMNFIECSVLWERGGSASADRVQSHFEDKGVLPVKRARRQQEAPEE